MIHKPLLEKIAPDEWTGLSLWVLLLHEDSTAVPVAADQFVSSLDPATNECDHADYTRLGVSSLTATWSTDHWVLDGGNVNFGPLASEHAGQGVSLVALYSGTDDPGDDAANLLLKTYVVSPVAEFDGGDVIVSWHANGIAQVAEG